MSKICDNCAQEMPDNAAVCSLCGEELPGSTGTEIFGPNEGQVVMPPLAPPLAPPATPPLPLYREPISTANQGGTFCGKCGAALRAGAHFCVSCGKVVEAETNFVQPANFNTIPTTIPKKKKLNNKSIGVIACAVALVVVIIVAINIFSVGNNPKKILKNYMTASLSQDFNTITKYSAYDFNNLIKEMYTSQGLTEKEFLRELEKQTGFKSIKDIFNNLSKEAVTELKKEFGSNYKVSFEIIDSSPLKKSDITSSIDNLSSFFDRNDYNGSKIIKLDRITEMVEYDIEVTIKGNKDEDTANITFVMVKVGGKWRVFDDIRQLTRMF